MFRNRYVKRNLRDASTCMHDAGTQKESGDDMLNRRHLPKDGPQMAFAGVFWSFSGSELERTVAVTIELLIRVKMSDGVHQMLKKKAAKKKTNSNGEIETTVEAASRMTCKRQHTEKHCQ